MAATNFFGPDGKLMSAAQFVQSLYDTLRLSRFPQVGGTPSQGVVGPGDESGVAESAWRCRISRDDLTAIQALIDAQTSDLFDVLQYVAYAKPTMTRKERVDASRKPIYEALDPNQREFVDFVLSQYVDLGVDELQRNVLPQLLAIKYQSQMEGIQALGGTEKARATFIGFQRKLYSGPIGRTGEVLRRSAPILLGTESHIDRHYGTHMPDLATISAALSSLKTATDIAKFLRQSDLSLEKAELKLKFADLVSALADAKMELAEVQETLHEKDQRISELEQSFQLNATLVRHYDAYYAADANGTPSGCLTACGVGGMSTKQDSSFMTPKTIGFAFARPVVRSTTATTPRTFGLLSSSHRHKAMNSVLVKQYVRGASSNCGITATRV